MRPLRILLVGDYPDDPRLGSAKVPHKLREEFRAAGHACDAIFTADIGSRPSARQVRQLVSPALAVRAVYRAQARQPYDVVDIASAEGIWFGAGQILGQWPDTVYICRSNGIEHRNYRRMLDDSRDGLTAKPWSRRVWYPLSRLSQVAAAARLADRLIVLTESDRQFALDQGWQPADRVCVVPHGVSERFFCGAPADAARGAGALFCGSWDHMKGIRYLVDAFGALAAAGRPVPLTILGPGPDAATVRGAFSEAARRHVRVIDRVPEDRVIEEYRRHDLLVFPSTYEGFGLVVIEAMSQGLPVVATPVGCVPDLVRDGESGAVVPLRDSRALADTVARLMADPEERVRLGGGAMRRVAGMTWARTAARTLAVYEDARASLRGRR